MSRDADGWERAMAALRAGDTSQIALWTEHEETPDEQRFEGALLLAEHGALEAARHVGASVRSPELARELDCLFEDRPDEGTLEDDTEEELEETTLGPRVVEMDDAAALFLEWIGGRRDLYASQWYDERRRRSGYRPVERPLTLPVVRAHLEGQSTVGQYLLFPDGSVSFGVLDLDLDAGVLASWQATQGEEASPVGHPVVRSFLRALTDAGRALGIALFAEGSGGKGAHVWAFFRPRKPARAVRALLQAIVRAAGAQPPEVSVELFPKQEVPGPRGLSSLVKLPLGIHQTTGRRCPFLDDDLRPISDATESLRRLRAVDLGAMDAVVGGRVALLPAPELAGREPLPKAERAVLSTAVLAEALRGIGMDEEPACAERMLAGCDALRTMLNRGIEARRFAPDEARAVAYTLGLLGTAPRTARDAFARTETSSRELERLQRGLPPPMGCAKLRAIAKVPRCSGCVAHAMPYATPGLLALGGPIPTRARTPGYVDALDGVLAEDPFETIGASLRRIEGKLDAIGGRPEEGREGGSE